MRRAITLGLLALAGCGGGEPEPEVRTTPAQTPVPAAGDACGRFIPKEPLRVPKGLLLPEGEVTVGKVTRVAPQVRVEGYVTSQPSQVRSSFLESREVRVTFSEDEGFEAEALITNGRYQNFWKVSKVCDRGSAFAAIVVKEAKPFKLRGTTR